MQGQLCSGRVRSVSGRLPAPRHQEGSTASEEHPGNQAAVPRLDEVSRPWELGISVPASTDVHLIEPLAPRERREVLVDRPLKEDK